MLLLGPINEHDTQSPDGLNPRVALGRFPGSGKRWFAVAPESIIAQVKLRAPGQPDRLLARGAPVLYDKPVDGEIRVYPADWHYMGVDCDPAEANLYVLACCGAPPWPYDRRPERSKVSANFINCMGARRASVWFTASSAWTIRGYVQTAANSSRSVTLASGGAGTHVYDFDVELYDAVGTDGGTGMSNTPQWKVIY